MKKLTHEEFLKCLDRPDITILGTYNGWREYIEIKCNVCGHIWKVTACNLINGSGCPICANKKRKESQIWGHDKFVEALAKVNSNIRAIERYDGYNTYIKFHCDICENEWMMTPHDALGTIPCGCPKCSHEKRKATFREKYGGDSPFASQIIRDKAAKSYAAKGWTRVKSIGENTIKSWLNEHNISYQQEAVFEDCRDQRMLPFDFKIVDKSGEIVCLIEYDGEQHTRGWDGEPGSLEIIQKHDLMKTEYCRNNKLKLIRISHLENPVTILEEELKSMVN